MNNTHLKEKIECKCRKHNPYCIRFDQYKTESSVPFLIPAEPYVLDEYCNGEQLLGYFGEAFGALFAAHKELYESNFAEVQKILGKGQPSFFKDYRSPEYLFYKIDLMPDPENKYHYFVCEVDTSIFGLGLAELLRSSFYESGCDTIVPPNRLQQYIEEQTSPNGVFAYSEKCAAYVESLHYLAEEVFSANGRHWTSQKIDKNFSSLSDTIYRAFYLHEYVSDENVRAICKNGLNLLPSLTPYYEDRALWSALIFDDRFEQKYRQLLGEATFNFIREVSPKTWIVGEEEHFSPGLPCGITSTKDLSSLSKKQRAYVVKSPVFGAKPSWGEGLTFLHQARKWMVEESLKEACTSDLSIIQEFRETKKREMSYFSQNGEIQKMDARVRVCAFFANMGQNIGQPIAALATGCDDGSLKVHGKHNAVNTAVA